MLLTIVLLILSLVIGVMLAALVLDALARRQRALDLRESFGRIRRRIESDDLIVNYLPVLLHELRNLMLDNEELAGSESWRGFERKWLSDSSVVEGRAVNWPWWTVEKSEELSNDLQLLPFPSWNSLKWTRRGPTGGTWAGGLSIVSILALLVAVASLILTVTGQHNADAQFELQRRPWLKVDVSQPFYYYHAESSRVDFEIRNHGQGSALNCRMAAVVNGSALPLDLHSEIGTGRRDALRWSFVPPGMQLYSPDGIAAFVDTASLPASHDTLVHFCLVFDGLETGRRYYSEQIMPVDCGLGRGCPEARTPAVIVYRVTGKRRLQ